MNFLFRKYGDPIDIFSAWEGTWNGTARTTSCAQNAENFASFADITEICPLTEDRLYPSYVTRVFLIHASKRAKSWIEKPVKGK